jgi:hypothetical protein
MRWRPGWRQSAYQLRQVKKLYRQVQRLKHSTAKDPDKRAAKQELFERDTEWISKGKAGVPVELGLRVAVVKDQYRFILHHQVMQQTTDDQVAVALMTETRARFPGIASASASASFDKGFHSPANQTALAAMIPQVVMPKKGKRSLCFVLIAMNDHAAKFPRGSE